MLALATLLLAAMLPLSAWMLVRNPFNIAAITSFLTWAFGVGPALYFLNTGDIPSYSWRNFVFVGGPLSIREEAVATLVILCTMSALFTVGASAGWMFSPRPSPAVVQPRDTSDFTTAVMASIWGVSALYFFQLAGWDIKDFLLPVREAKRGSGYLQTIFIMMPLAIVAKSYWASGRLGWNSLLWIGISVMAEFSRNQRRDFVTMALFLVALLALVHEIMPKRGTRRNPSRDIHPGVAGSSSESPRSRAGRRWSPSSGIHGSIFRPRRLARTWIRPRSEASAISFSAAPRQAIRRWDSSATISATPARTSFIFPAT